MKEIKKLPKDNQNHSTEDQKTTTNQINMTKTISKEDKDKACKLAKKGKQFVTHNMLCYQGQLELLYSLTRETNTGKLFNQAKTMTEVQKEVRNHQEWLLKSSRDPLIRGVGNAKKSEQENRQASYIPFDIPKLLF